MRVINYFFSAIFLITLYTCGITSPSEDNKIHIKLSSFNISENDTLIVELQNNTSKEVLLYWNTLNSPIQKKDSLNNWKSISLFNYKDDSVLISSDYYTPLNRNGLYSYKITQDIIKNYIEDITGIYRVVFSIIYNEDYQHIESLYSDNFKIDL